MTAAIALRPMSAAQFLAWLPPQIESYAAAKIRSGNWPAAGALERSRQETNTILPQGVATPGHRLFYIVEQRQGGAVGSLWVKMPASGRPGVAFIYNIAVDEGCRGQGYGSAALAELERMLAAEGGVTSLALHVFGYNTGAQRLYQRLGFTITNINMAKPITAGAP